jgi:hypothetical protein
MRIFTERTLKLAGILCTTGACMLSWYFLIAGDTPVASFARGFYFADLGNRRYLGGFIDTGVAMALGYAVGRTRPWARPGRIFREFLFVVACYVGILAACWLLPAGPPVPWAPRAAGGWPHALGAAAAFALIAGGAMALVGREKQALPSPADIDRMARERVRLHCKLAVARSYVRRLWLRRKLAAASRWTEYPLFAAPAPFAAGLHALSRKVGWVAFGMSVFLAMVGGVGPPPAVPPFAATLTILPFCWLVPRLVLCAARWANLARRTQQDAGAFTREAAGAIDAHPEVSLAVRRAVGRLYGMAPECVQLSDGPGTLPMAPGQHEPLQAEFMLQASSEMGADWVAEDVLSATDAIGPPPASCADVGQLIVRFDSVRGAMQGSLNDAGGASRRASGPQGGRQDV